MKAPTLAALLAWSLVAAPASADTRADVGLLLGSTRAPRNFSITTPRNRVHNVVASGGLVVRF